MVRGLPSRDGLWERVCSLYSLSLAWSRVKANEGSPGVDRVSVAEFESNLDENLNDLSVRLELGDYSPLPVLRTYIPKESGGQRPIGIPAVRDRIVQQSLLTALSPIFDWQFLDCSFAYRPGRSALDAIRKVEALLKEGHIWVLDADIERFFETIDHTLLLEFVAETIHERMILDLIQRFLKAGVFDNMSFREEYLGIAQGSVISPLLANIYLHRFDKQMMENGYHLIRYADDFLVLERSEEMIGKAMADVAAALSRLSLCLSKRKTRIIPVSAGFIFLGYYFDDKGKGPSKKAIEAVQRNLLETSNADKRKSIDERVHNLKQVIRGWSSYFGSCRGIETKDAIALIAAMEISLEMSDYENARELLEKRGALAGNDPEVHYRLGRLAKRMGMKQEALHEFSQALSFAPDHIGAKEEVKQIGLAGEDAYTAIKRLRKLIHDCPDFAQPYRDLSFCYAEVGEYGLAQESLQKALELEAQAVPEEPVPVSLPQRAEPPTQLAFSEEDIHRFLALFKGRTDVYGYQWIDDRGRRGFHTKDASLTPEAIRSHLAGEQTLGLYLMDEKDQVHLAVIDIDIDHKALVEYAGDKSMLNQLYQLVQKETSDIASLCDDLGVPVGIEDSGYKGRHLWFFFATPISAKIARRFLKFLCDRTGKPRAGIHREVFPYCDRVQTRGYGPLVKLPLGVHKRTNRRCLLLDRQGTPFSDQPKALSEIRLISQRQIEDILLSYAPGRQFQKPDTDAGKLVNRVLSGCMVIRYLVNKSRDTHYLDHSERITLLYSLGHLGEEGKSYLHKVISNCINYDYEYTQRQIRKRKPFPISCARIREKHESFALELGCDCTFKLPPKGYPAPILHAFKDGHTWPVSTHVAISRDVATGIDRNNNDFNELMRRYIELKRQLAGIEKSLRRIEEEMAAVMKQRGKNSVATEFGIMEMREHGNRVDWIIKP